MFPDLNGAGIAGLMFDMVSRFVATLALCAFPLGIAFSVMHYRLWDVDAMIHRGAVYAAMTVILIVLFVGCVLVIQLIAGHLNGGMQSGIGLVASGIMFGALFNPARRWLRTQVDRRMYGIQVSYQTPAKSAGAQDSGRVESGTRLGPYEVIEPIGRGGMADVYKGHDANQGRTVAIKVLPPDLALQADFRRRFEREARTIAALKHPNIVQLFDFGETNGTYYMVMEYLTGDALSGYLARSGPLALDVARPILADIASALDYAHQQGIVHRDVKPSNVMLHTTTTPPVSAGKHKHAQRSGAADSAILTDFGIARLTDGGTRITRSGAVGTFDYISPEQIRDAKDVDGRADIYSLGVTAFQMLTGRLPFAASNPGALLIAHLQQPAPDPREFRQELPEKAAEAILRSLEKDPSHRYQTAGEFAAALNA
jgi:serine/threonine protein kinase